MKKAIAVEVTPRSVRLSAKEREEIAGIIKSESSHTIRQIEGSDPAFPERFAERLRKRAIGLLKVDRECVEVSAIDEQIKILERKKRIVEKRISAKMPKQDRDRYGNKTKGCPLPMDLCSAIGSVEDRIRVAEKVKDPTGKKLVEAERSLSKKLSALATCVSREDVARAGII